MGKNVRKLKQKFIAILAAVCVFNSMPYTFIIASAEENMGSPGTAYETVSGQEENENTEQADADGTEIAAENPEQAETEKTEEGDLEEEETEQPGSLEVAEKPDEPDNQEEAVQPEEADDQEGVEQTENEDDGEAADPEETEQEDPVSGDEPENEETEKEESEPEETDHTDEPESDEEISRVSIMAFSEPDEELEIDAATVEAAEDDTYTDGNGILYHYHGYEDGTAEIYEVESYLGGKEMDIPADVNGYTVTRLTFTVSIWAAFSSVTIPETITYMDSDIFHEVNIGRLYYNAVDALVGEVEANRGVFAGATIQDLSIGENVKVIPDHIFSRARIVMDELTLDVETIGEFSFYYNTSITDLTIGEDVKMIGAMAFQQNRIENIHYNAVNAALKNEAQTSGPFFFCNTSTISFSDRVEALPDRLFDGIIYSADRLDLPENLTKIGEEALSSRWMQVGEMTVGENITEIGARAFYETSIDVLNYNAIEAETPDMELFRHYTNPFNACSIGELRIGDSVKSLFDNFFYDVVLAQDELVLPDSLLSIGSYVLASSATDGEDERPIVINNLVVGKNVSGIGNYAFSNVSFESISVYAVGTKPAFGGKPTAGNVTIHGNSYFYDYFTSNTEKDNITLLCEDFETAYGEEYFDEGKHSFVTPVTDTCTVCGYKVTSEEYEEGYTVIFEDYDGRELSRQHVHKGTDATAPNEPELTGYQFTGWDKSYANVTSDTTVRAQYKILTFHVVFKDGEKTISDQEIDYGGSAKLPEEPARPVEEWGSWKFTGWQGNYEVITQDETLYAQFEKLLNEYEVIFYDAQGGILSRQTVTHGNSAKVPEAPKKEPTAQYSYTFTGWDGDTENITGKTGFHPLYEARTRSYTVTFMNGSTAHDTQTVEYGQAADTPADPIKEPDGTYTYRFLGWDGDYSFITGDTVIYAQFEKERLPGSGKNEPTENFTVIFADYDGTELSRQSVNSGEDAVPPDTPERTGYQFTGWDKEYINITSDLTITAQYKIKSYTVIFMDGDTVLDEQEVEHGSDATAPEDPMRPEEEWGTWRFTGWDGSYTDITQEEVIHAKFEKVFHEYEVIFHDADGNVLSRQTVIHGSGAKLPEAPEKEATAQYRYIFTGWDGDTENITGDSSFYPVYETRTRTYTVVFMNGTAVLEKQNVKYGMSAITPPDPEKEADGEYTYRFAGWDKDYSFVTGNMTIYALFDRIKIPETGAGEDNEESRDDDKGREPDPENEDDTGDMEIDEKADLVLDFILTKKHNTVFTLDLEIGEGQKPGAETAETLPAGPETVSEDDPISPDVEESEDTPDDHELPADSKDFEETEETVMEGDGERGKTPYGLVWLFILIVILLLAFLSIWLFFFCYGRKKVCGTVLDKEEEPMSGIRITLVGKDVLETLTDEDGHFSFDGLKKGSYKLDIFHDEGQEVLSMNISMKEKEEEDIFTVLTSSHSRLETKKDRKKYVIDVTT